jgi:hypothetical protein
MRQVFTCSVPALGQNVSIGRSLGKMTYNPVVRRAKWLGLVALVALLLGFSYAAKAADPNPLRPRERPWKGSSTPSTVLTPA